MIFLTVGSQMPFRRLVRAVDDWAKSNPSVEVLAQVGIDMAFRPTAIKAFDLLHPARYTELVQASDLVVAHAGMGSVLTALEHGKPMLLMPRRGSLNETRNDHQLATLRWLKCKPGIYPAEDEVDLKASLDRWRAIGLAPPPAGSARTGAMQSLVDSLKAFIG